MYALIHNIFPFDANKTKEITFAWSGNQIFKVRCIIRDAVTGLAACDITEETMRQSITIPAKRLQNGKKYVCYITTFDINNNESALQPTGTLFSCFSTPLFNVSIMEGDIIRSSQYSVTINYSQAERDNLDYFTVYLYSQQGTLLQTSGTIYTEDRPDYQLSDSIYIISGLENAKDYYIRATGQTVGGMQLDTRNPHTGRDIMFTVAYAQSGVFTTLELNNQANIGAIEIRSNITSTEGKLEKDRNVFIDGKYADLRDNSITFDVGYYNSGDFSKAIVFHKPIINKVILTFVDKDQNMVVDIYYREGNYESSNGRQSYFELNAECASLVYVRTSNFTDIPNESQQFSLLVNRKEHLYDLKAVLIDKK